MVKPILSENTFFQFLSTIKVNLVPKIMQSAYLCVIFHVKYKKLPISHGFKVFRYGFSEAIPIFFNRFKSDVILV